MKNLWHSLFCRAEKLRWYRVESKPKGLAVTVCRDCGLVRVFEAAFTPSELDALNTSEVLKGRVVEADGPPPKWKPEQHGNVIMQEPDLVRAEREHNEAL